MHTAIQTGLAAAATIQSVLSSDGDTAAGLEYYNDLVRASVAYHRRTAGRLYAKHQQFAAQPFWRRRSEPGPEAPASRAIRPRALVELLPQSVRLRPPAELRLVPSRIGDRIVRQQALTSPDLDRPVAYLAGKLLAPLIKEMEAAPTLAQALHEWETTMPPDRAAAILAWLIERGLLEGTGTLRMSAVPHSR